MTPQEYQLTAQLAQGSATWRNYVTNLFYTAAGTNPTRPASPSVNVTILQLS